MFSSLFNKFKPSKKRPVLIGDIYVNGRSDFKRFLEFNSDGENSPEELKAWIKDLLEIPMLDESQDIDYDSLILDVAVRKYQAGTDIALYSYPFIPVLWRPSIHIDVRLRDYNTNKTIGEYTVKKIMGWGEFFNRTFSFRSFFSLKGTFTPDDLKELLAKALMDALVWATKLKKI